MNKKSHTISDKTSEILSWCRKFCSPKNFVHRKIQSNKVKNNRNMGQTERRTLGTLPAEHHHPFCFDVVSELHHHHYHHHPHRHRHHHHLGDSICYGIVRSRHGRVRPPRSLLLIPPVTRHKMLHTTRNYRSIANWLMLY